MSCHLYHDDAQYDDAQYDDAQYDDAQYDEKKKKKTIHLLCLL